MVSRDRERQRLATGILLLAAAAAASAALLAWELAGRGSVGPHPDARSIAVTVSLVVAAGTTLAVAIGATVIVARERRRSARLEDWLATMSQSADQSGDLFTIVSRRGRIEYVNPAVERATGFLRSELVGRRHAPWLPWYESESLFENVRAVVMDGGTFSGRVACRRKDGASLVLQEQMTALTDEAGRVAHYVSTATDLTRETRLTERLKFLRANDPVTQLPNRRSFSAAVAERIREDARVTVMMIDIDRFKAINDVFGVAVGDEVLKRFARILATAVGNRDLVARLGSDEFGVIHRYEGRLDDPTGLAERIRQAISAPLTVGDREVVSTVTIGMATFPEHGRDEGALLRHAGMALAAAKAQGRNGVLVFDPDLSQRLIGAYSLDRHLAGALRNGEYEVGYQPYYHLGTRELVGAEALLRWHNPELGAVAPSLFVPALEDSGAILEVGEWVLRSACRQVGEWAERGRPVGVAVNLSGVQFRHSDLVPLVTTVVREAGIDPRLLTLELTEGICIDDMDRAIGILQQLKDVGLALSIDDFGTGYSSLSYIRKLPIDTLKIDQSFVHEVSRDPDAASIVTAITGVARSLGLRTIAEGVESEEQRNVLRLLRCDYGQGFLYSPAVPAPDFERLHVAPVATA